MRKRRIHLAQTSVAKLTACILNSLLMRSCIYCPQRIQADARPICASEMTNSNAPALHAPSSCHLSMRTIHLVTPPIPPMNIVFHTHIYNTTTQHAPLRSFYSEHLHRLTLCIYVLQFPTTFAYTSQARGTRSLEMDDLPCSRPPMRRAAAASRNSLSIPGFFANAHRTQTRPRWRCCW